MKPTLVADEMFPEGAGPYGMDLDEVGTILIAFCSKFSVKEVVFNV